MGRWTESLRENIREIRYVGLALMAIHFLDNTPETLPHPNIKAIEHLLMKRQCYGISVKTGPIPKGIEMIRGILPRTPYGAAISIAHWAMRDAGLTPQLRPRGRGTVITEWSERANGEQDPRAPTAWQASRSAATLLKNIGDVSLFQFIAVYGKT